MNRLRALTESPRLVWRGISLVASAGIRLPIVFGTLDILSGVLVAVELLLIREITESFLADESAVDVTGLILFGVVTAGRRLMASTAVQLRLVAAERVEWVLVRDVITKGAMAPFQRFEDPAFHDNLNRATTAARVQAFNVVAAVLAVTNNAVTALSLVIVMTTVAPDLLLPFAIAGLVLVVVGVVQARLQYDFQYGQTHDERERGYVRDALTSRAEGKEIRLFGSRRLLIDRYEDLQSERLRQIGILVRKRLANDLLGNVALAGALVGVFAVIAVRARDGDIELADAAVAALTAQQLAGRVQSVVSGITQLREATLFLGDLTTFIADAGDVPPDPTGPPPQPTAISLDEVWFTYPDAPQPALEGVSLQVDAGEVVALVGENGSGKSTIAKLFAGLYQPDAGRVLAHHDEPTVVTEPQTGVVSALFQDFARYEMTVRENVWLGAPWRPRDDATIDDVLAQSGADSALGRLPDGLASRLGRRFEGGLDLSIGQWQRLALARAFFSPTGFLVLDEPTASLDPKVEADLFDRLRELCAGRGVLLISHRFSTVRSADRIVVLDEGRVAETGTHEDLMARAGVYAALYRLQADRYQT